MSTSPITNKRDDSFQTALNLLRQGGVRHIPVLVHQASPSPATSLSIYEIEGDGYAVLSIVD